MNWIDSRLKKPKSNSYDKYFVAFKILPDADWVSLGISAWQPKENYTDGDWVDVCSTNGNKHSGCEVLYWMPHPGLPIIIVGAK